MLLGVDFWIAQKIINITGQDPFSVDENWSTGEGWEAKGAWVDGVWYNLTWLDGTYAYFDENGTVAQSPFPAPSQIGHWMEGVRVYERTIHTNAGTTKETYLNMNGTWTDVTGRIIVDKVENGPTYTMTGAVVHQKLFFQPATTPEVNSTYTNENFGYTQTKNIPAGKNAFDNLFAPGQSRLIVLKGNWEVREPWANVNPVDTLKSGSITPKTMTNTVVDINPDLSNSIFVNTWSDATEIQ